jgi:hypothetical protein
MLTNQMQVQPDERGDLVQKIAHEIRLLDAHALVPNDIREARRMLERLEHERRPMMESAQSRRSGQYHELYNGALRTMARARQLGLRPPDAKLPEPPHVVNEDALQALRETIAELYGDVEAYEKLTPEQRRIMQLEASTKARFEKVIDYANRLSKRIDELEARIGEHAA